MKRTRSRAIDDVARSLTWPRLMKAGGLALRPARVVMSLVLMLIVGLIARAPTVWLGKDTGPAHTFADKAQGGFRAVQRSIFDFDVRSLAGGLWQACVDAPIAAAREFPWSTLAIAIPILIAWGIFGGAMSRMAAEEHALKQQRAWTTGLAFAVARWFSFAACLIGPVAVLLVVCGVMACAGWVLLGFQYVNIAGGVLYGLGLAIGTIVAVLGAALLLGSPMLVPAMACEGSDAIDSVQRVWAYTLARPGRLAVYLLILLVQLVLALWALGLLAGAAESLTAWSTTALLPGETAEALREAAAGGDMPTDTKDSVKTAGRILAFWGAIPDLLVGAFAVSFWFSGGTVLYLCMRRVCDGQDVEELWRPHMTPGTVPPPSGADDDDGED